MQSNIEEVIPDTQQRILDSARQLFFSRSYADVGVASICEQAGVKKGSFYHFYPSKQALTLAVVDAFYIQMKEQLIDLAFVDDVPPLDRLVRLADSVYHMQSQIARETGQVLGCPFGNLSNELATQDEPIRSSIERVFFKLQTMIDRVLQEAQEHGQLPSVVDTPATAQAILAYLEGVLLLAKNQNDAEVIRKLLPAFAQIRIHKNK